MVDGGTISPFDSIQNQIKTFFATDAREDIFEITYAYTHIDGHFYNRTVFGQYAGCSPDDHVDAVIQQTRKKIDADKALLQTMIVACDQIDDWRVSMYKNMLLYTIEIWDFLWWGVPFEAQKYWSSASYTQYDLQGSEHQVQSRDAALFGEFIQHHSWEVSRCDCFLSGAFSRYENDLDTEEKKRFQGYIDLVRSLPSRREDLCHVFDEPSLLDHPLFDQKISRDVYKEMFAAVFKIYGLSIRIDEDERSSIYDGRDTLFIPSNPGYASLPLGKVLRLIAHEIETHYLVLANTETLLGGIKGGGNLVREEGLAVFQEFLLSGQPLSEVDISDSMPLILMGELLESTEYLDFLNLYRKMHGLIAEGSVRLLRSKRNYPLRGKGNQHKDAAYSRGLYQVRNYVMAGGLYQHLFLSKVNFEDISVIMKHVSDEVAIQPLFVALHLVAYIYRRYLDRDDVYAYYLQQYPFLKSIFIPGKDISEAYTNKWNELTALLDATLPNRHN